MNCPKCRNYYYMEYEHSVEDYYCTHCKIWRKTYLRMAYKH